MIADSYFCGGGKLGSSGNSNVGLAVLFCFCLFVCLCFNIYSPNTTILIVYLLKCSQSIFVFRWIQKVSKKKWKSS